MDYAINLYNNVKQSNDLVADITPIAQEYTDNTRAMGGYWTGSFTLRDLPLAELEEWYNYHLGYRVVRTSNALIKWEGFIAQMRLTSGGQTYVRDLNTMVNRALVYYSNAAGSTITPTGWNQNNLSISNFGQREETYTLDGVATAVATDYRDTQLTRYGWPRSVSSGGMLYSDQDINVPPSLVVNLCGYVFTLNWRYVVSSNPATTDLTSFMTTLINESEFITPGNLVANTRQLPQRFLSPMRTWDAIEKLNNIGDQNGQRYVVKVGPNRKLDYQLAATDVGYYVQDGRLYELDGSEVTPSNVVPDRLARRRDAPSGYWEGDNYSDPRNVYLSEIQFKVPGQINLMPDMWNVNDQLLAILDYNRAARKGKVVEHWRQGDARLPPKPRIND